ncbi:MAG: threonine synthase [Moorella humiferrea]|uniref:Threonine synthase n=1 Tax=Neomoorella humiferrea TaxID=676965 RepID=A0A2T0AVG5_9FIRM|nr:threonine synthase [Moorella humiferrea]MBE3571341.1 threonine synthase [Moorella humiferrea]PRR74670.1 Threonine synthase [Moorella humiferrea]
MSWPGVIRAYREFLPVTEATPLITLQEGNTPLIAAGNLSRELGIKLYFKFEGLNPTGSFKDRGMVMAVAKAVEAGSKAIMCASTGNTSASAAAYAARCGLKCSVLIPEGNIALGKLAQALFYGARVIAIQGNFDDALDLVRRITAKYPITLVNSINPFRIEGQKTAAFEVCDWLGEAPDYLAIPVGNAGNITAYWKGFNEYYQAGRSHLLPKMIGFQAEGAAPIVRGEIVPNPETVATAIRIGNPASWQSAVRAAKESGGFIDCVSDEEILAAQRLMASAEGIFAEPASAASLAGVIKYVKKGYFHHGDRVVCVLTGNGLKDPNIAIKQIGEPLSLPPEEARIVEAIL